MKDTTSARAYFSGDVFAAETCGITIEEARPDYARCVLNAGGAHLNARGAVMGGALFTLADFTFAVAANDEQTTAVSVSCTITYHSAARPGALFAEARCLKAGRRVCSYLISITDAAGALIATATSTGVRTPRGDQ